VGRPAPVEAENVVVIRTDRVGDLILSTPLFEAVRIASPRCRISGVAAPYALPVLKENRFVDESIAWEGNGSKMAGELGRRGFDAAIVLNPSFESCLAVWRAGIPYRTGPLSRPSSFLFLNRGLRQRRSRSPLHQSELDAEFASLVTGGTSVPVPPPTLRLTGEEREEGARILAEAGAGGDRPVAGIHPGSGDSVLSWPEERFVEVGRLLAAEGWRVVVTGGGPERESARRVASAIGGGAVAVAEDRPLRSFFGLLSRLDLFVAPSTGPLHAAAALGVPVAAPFPPLPSQSPGRWGPRTKSAFLLSPSVDCPARTRCRKRRCPDHPCMEKIGAEDLFRGAARLARAEGRRP